MDNRFNLEIWRGPDDRIKMTQYEDCPLDILHIVADHDTEPLVLLQTAFAPNADDAVKEKIMKRLDMTAEELAYKKALTEDVNYVKTQEVFCAIPWNHVSTNANGSVRMCCQMIYDSDVKDSPGFGTVYKDDGSVLHGKDDVLANRNAPAWKKIRKQMLSQEKPSICKLCWDEEDNGLGSRRQWTNDVFENFQDKAMLYTDEDGSIDNETFPVEYWDIRFGNKCNLACRSCGPTDSDLWYDDWVKIKADEGLGPQFVYRDTGPVEIKIDEDTGKAYVDDEIFNWYNDSALWHNIVDNADKIKRIYFTGGEPTVNKKHREMLDLFISTGQAEHIILDYNTNMAGLPSSIFAQWKKFKEVHLGMSIDGIFEHFEYIRYPGKWAVVQRNLDRIDNEPGLDHIEATITLTLSSMNVLHALDMQWWLKEQKYKRIKDLLIIHNLYGPVYFNIQNLPDEIKQVVRTRYDKFMDDIRRRWIADEDWYQVVKQRFSSVINHMDEKEYDPAEWTRFIYETDKLDAIRDENMYESIPEIAQFVNRYRTPPDDNIIPAINLS